MKQQKKINIWTDGASIPNPGRGGYAAIVLEGDVPCYAVMGYEQETTNNRMEMMAVIASLETIDPGKYPKVYVHSDSQLIINTMTKDWGRGLNLDLWERVDCLNSKHDISWVKVKGHAGLRYNEECDALASYCIDKNIERMTVGYHEINQMLRSENA